MLYFCLEVEKPRLPLINLRRLMVIKQEEKRCFPRIIFHTPIRCQIRGEPEFGNAVCNNISAGGMSFVGDKFIAPSTPVMLEINILSRILKPIGKIVWSQPLPHSDRNRLGIEFLELDPIEKNYLQDFINMQINQ